jgi:glycosyltransferase involved in cell wall biosynthesis
MRTVLVYKSNLLPISETFIKEQVSSLRRWRGVLVGTQRATSSLSLEGLNLIQLGPDNPGLIHRIHGKLRRLSATMPRSAFRRLRQEGASLIHAHFGTDAVEAWPIAQALNLPMLATLHGFDVNVRRDWWEAGHGGWMARNYPRRLLQLARHPRVRFIAVSDAMRQSAISYGIPKDKISVCYIGVDSGKFAPGGRPITERDRRVLFIGRLVEKKGCEYLIRAFAKVQLSVPDATLVIIGDGPLRDGLQKLAQQLGVSLHMRGALSGDEVRRELHLARVLCLPSITAANGDAEGFGIVLLEAQAAGVPVVTSAAGGATEGISEGVTGYSFPECDIETMTARLIYVLTDDATAASMASSGPVFVAEKFDLFRCTESLERLYDRVLQQKRDGHVAQVS